MGTIVVTVGNRYLHGITEEFICRNVDVSDYDEMEYCAEECVGEYLDMHADVIHSLDVSYDALYDECYYSIEEVAPND